MVYVGKDGAHGVLVHTERVYPCSDIPPKWVIQIRLGVYAESKERKTQTIATASVTLSLLPNAIRTEDLKYNKLISVIILFQAEEGEEDEEVGNLFNKGKKKKKNEKSPAELALIVEHFMAELEVIAEEDAELNRQSKPAINKLRKLAMLVEVLSKCAVEVIFSFVMDIFSTV